MIHLFLIFFLCIFSSSLKSIINCHANPYTEPYLRRYENITLPNGISRFAIALTTIPPRFQSLAPTLRSWVHQVHKPTKICIYLPYIHKRFRKKHTTTGSRHPISSYDIVYRYISKDPILAKALSVDVIKIVMLDEDYGPITRFIGVLSEFERDIRNKCFEDTQIYPDYWLISDDDVIYSRFTTMKYDYYLERYHGNMPVASSHSHHVEVINPKLCLTQFVEDYRIYYFLRKYGDERDSKEIIPRHLQGVDTYLLTHTYFEQSYHERNLLNYHITTHLIEYLHEELCPESFYQDDYLVSFFLSLLEVPVYSIWNDDKLTVHVNNVSTSHFQMHLDKQVFFREEQTKSCLFTYASEIYQLALQLRQG
jgi:hypothetical protein